MKKYTRGTDPEFFLIDRKTGKFISAIPYIEGVKSEEQRLPSGGTVIRDNVALEFATPPVSGEEDFIESIRTCIKEVRKLIPKKFAIGAIPSGLFEDDQLDHPEAQEFGCSPDFCAWEVKQNEPPRAEDSALRTCGGHIHVGHVEGDGNEFLLDPWGKVKTVKVMDAIHGVISAMLDNSPEALRRKELYGKAGCHRPTHYGVEYRTLSNYWLKSPHLVRLMDLLTDDALKIMRDGANEELIESIGESRVRKIIDENDVKDAEAVFEKYLRPLLSKRSVELFEECRTKVEKYDFEQEWGVM